MPRKTKTEEELGMLRSFWDEVRVLEADYSAAVVMFVEPTKRPGVFKYRLVFTPLLEDQSNYLGSAAVQFEFPSAARQSLAGALWDHSMKLTRLITELAADRASRQKNGG